VRIDFQQRLKAIDGSELVENGKPVTLAAVAVNALLDVIPKQEEVTSEAKVQRWRIAQRIFAAEEPVDVTVEEVVIVKKLIGIGYAPLIVGQAFDLIERSA
jgi:hypothetical protein